MDLSKFKPLTAWAPVAMSLTALALVCVHLVSSGVAPQKDEGILAHLWQLLMAGRAPIVILYAAGQPRRAPKPALPVMGVQVAAAAAAIAPIYLLRW